MDSGLAKAEETEGGGRLGDLRALIQLAGGSVFEGPLQGSRKGKLPQGDLLVLGPDQAGEAALAKDKAWAAASLPQGTPVYPRDALIQAIIGQSFDRSKHVLFRV